MPVEMWIEGDTVKDVLDALTGFRLDKNEVQVIPQQTYSDDKDGGSVAETVAALDQAATVAANENPLANAIRNSIIGSIQRATGHTRAEVSQVVASVESGSGRPILDWLTSGGLIQFIQTIIALLAAFKTL